MSLLDRAAQRLLEGLKLKARAKVASTDQGGQRSETLNSGLEFADHRGYLPGDDVRQIDWKAFARHKTLTVRTFEEEKDVKIYVLVDVSASMKRGDPPKLEVARRMAAAFGYLGMKQFDQVRVVPFADNLEKSAPAMRSRNEFPALERFLTELVADGTSSFKDTTRTFSQRYPQRGVLIVLSDLMEAGDWSESLRLLARAGHQISVVRVTCKEDDDPEFRGELDLHDAETGQRMRLTMSRSLVHAYKKEVAEHVGRCRESCRKVGARFVEAPAETPTDMLLRSVLGPATESL